MRKILDQSPNFSKGTRNSSQIKFIIVHYTGMQSEIESIKRLKNRKKKVSCHYLINQKGKIVQMVSENKSAWHAGKSRWKSYRNLNTNSIGIELVNKGHRYGYEKFNNLQINSLISLCKNLRRKYKIKKNGILGHSDIAPLRKIDPGEKFPWEKLSKSNLGSWYRDLKNKQKNLKKKNTRNLFFKNLFKIGYRYFKLNMPKKTDRLIISAFQRRYTPRKVTGKLNEETLQISQFLAKTL